MLTFHNKDSRRMNQLGRQYKYLLFKWESTRFSQTILYFTSIFQRRTKKTLKQTVHKFTWNPEKLNLESKRQRTAETLNVEGESLNSFISIKYLHLINFVYHLPMVTISIKIYKIRRQYCNNPADSMDGSSQKCLLKSTNSINITLLL